MTPDSIILLTPDARLDALIALMQDALARAKADPSDETWNMHTQAWERLHEELMCQIDRPSLSIVKAEDMEAACAKELAMNADK